MLFITVPPCPQHRTYLAKCNKGLWWISLWGFYFDFYPISTSNSQLLLQTLTTHEAKWKNKDL